MKMILRKKRLLILSALLGIGGLYGCDKKEQNEWLPQELPQGEPIKPNIPWIEINGLYFEQKQLTLNHTKQECALVIRKNKIDHELFVLNEESWLNLAKTRALLAHESHLQIDAYSGWTLRKAKLVIRNSELKLSDTLTVTQLPEKRFDLSLAACEADIKKQVFTREIKHNIPITISIPKDVPWIRTDVTTVSDTISQLQITVQDNTESNQRECEVIISASELKLNQSIRVSQKGTSQMKKVTTMWVPGIQIPEKWDSLEVGDNVKIPVIFEKGNQGWYDNNKLEDSYKIPFGDGERVISDRNHCWALVACNMIHWWVDQNRDNITRYEQVTGKQILNQITYDVSLNGKGLNEKDRSSLARLIRESCVDKPYHTIDALKWFLSGRSLDRVQYPNRPAPGWFADVFPINSKEEIKLCSYYSIRNYERACKMIRDELETKRRVLAFTHSLGVATSHIITLYGAEFSPDGKIIALYGADSDDQRHQITRYGFTADKNGYSRLVNPRTGKIMNKMPQHLFFLDNAQDAWNNYWNK